MEIFVTIRCKLTEFDTSDGIGGSVGYMLASVTY